VPVIAAGGIAAARTAAAALLLGASALQIGTALLRCPEAGIAPSWQAALAVAAAAAPEAPEPAPCPVQRGLTAAMRKAAEAAADIAHLQARAGQGAALARPAPTAGGLRTLWRDSTDLPERAH
jgi:nitronate monooxygenase